MQPALGQTASSRDGGGRVSLSLFQLLLILIVTLTFAFSYVVAPYHFGGDQAHYIKAYSEMAGLSLGDALYEYPRIIHTAEPIHLLIVWVTSSLGLEKNFVMAAANALLVSLFAQYLRRRGAGILMVVWMTFSAYYLQTMFFTLERTKFAVIFMLIYLLSQRRWWILVAVFTHVMMLIPLVLVMIGQNSPAVSTTVKTDRFNCSLRKIILFVFGLVFIAVVINSLGAHLHYKFLAYYNENLISDSFVDWQLLLLCCLTLLTSKEKNKVLVFYVGLLVLAALVSGARVNMLGYFGFLYFSNFRLRAFRFSAFLLGCYFFQKSWLYISNIYNYGG